MTPEGRQAIDIANRVLDNSQRDPDSDISILARQLLRAVELIGLEKQNCRDVAKAAGITPIFQGDVNVTL